jgi:hypothetical protein
MHDYAYAHDFANANASLTLGCYNWSGFRIKFGNSEAISNQGVSVWISFF